MANDGISVHLANLEAALVASPARRLVANHFLPPLGPRLPLVLHHVLEAHSVDRPQENSSRNLLPRGPIVQNLVAVLFVALVLQQGSNGRLGTPVIHKGRTIGHGPERCHGLAHELLQILGNRHAARNGVRIHNHVGDQARRRPRHVVPPQKDPRRALLAMAIRVARPLANLRAVSPHQKYFRRHPQAVDLAVSLVGQVESVSHDPCVSVHGPTKHVAQAHHIHHLGGRHQVPLRLPAQAHIEAVVHRDALAPPVRRPNLDQGVLVLKR